MIVMLTRSEALRYDPPIQAEQQVAEGEKRREQQVHFLTDVAEGTDAPTFIGRARGR